MLKALLNRWRKMFPIFIVTVLGILAKESVRGAVHVPDSELAAVSEALLGQDTHDPGRWISVDPQSRTQFESTSDQAPNKLLRLRKEVFSIPTISKLIQLYNNYEVDAFQSEMVSREERAEESALLDAVLNTTLMQQTKSFLHKYGFVGRSDAEFKRTLSDIWFTLYSRGRNKIGSSAFEHIFLAELKNGEITGLHNWIYFSYEEHLGHVNYLGWLKKIEFPHKSGSGVMKLKYSWGSSKLVKHSNSLFIGTSPELEIALYTICFFARPNDKCHLTLDGKKFFIQTYSFKYQGKTLIGSAYPVI